MAEIVLAEGDDLAQVAQSLLEAATDPADVMWSPRPDVPQGGVYVVPDELAASYNLPVTKGRRGRNTTTDAGTPADGTGTAA